MKGIPDRFRSDRGPADIQLEVLQRKFASFLALLDANNRVLKVIGDMEEKAQGEHHFDVNYIRSGLAEIETGVREIIDRMVALGGSSYEPLRDRLLAISAQIEDLFKTRRPIRRDAYALPFEALSRERASSVGSKSAQLGELKAKLGLPVPDGFAITAWAYKRFVDANALQERITGFIKSVDIQKYDVLAGVSSAIQAMVSSSPVPADLVQAIEECCRNLTDRSGSRTFSIRSSAIAEDSLFSFAGQYRSFLNVRPEELIERYRGVLASKFTPQAIYYLLSHELNESELAMSACCVAMVDAAASGVVYTRDPVHPEGDCILVSSIYGLGKYLVDGKLTPDMFCVSRATGQVSSSSIAAKTVRLVLAPGGGTAEEEVPKSERLLPSLGEGQLKILAAYAARIEEHYGGPQDIEWALDRSGRLFLLQTRPLRVIRISREAEEGDYAGFKVLRSGGVTVYPGAACGPLRHAASSRDLGNVPRGSVLVARHPFPGLVTAMDRIAALITEVGGVASHMAALAREYRLPTLAGVDRAAELPDDLPVTVDATGSKVYAGAHPEFCRARRKAREAQQGSAAFGLLLGVLDRVSRLNLLNPAHPEFTIGNCRTLHDLTRYCHQKAMDEMFAGAKSLDNKERGGLRLKTDIPLEVHIIHLDPTLSKFGDSRWIEDDKIASVPMRAFWRGVRTEIWVTEASPTNGVERLAGFATRPSTPDRAEFSETSFALLGREYMIISLGLGYHFTTVEAMCTAEPGKNYIRIQYKGGGAAPDRRIRRIRLVQDILSQLGFEHFGGGDFLDSSVAYLDAAGTQRTLVLLGRITMLTKQLDMALSNDAITLWYTEDILRRLGLQGLPKRRAPKGSIPRSAPEA